MRRNGGLTLIELIMGVVISMIAMFGLALPLISGQLSSRIGFRQTEAQRDAQLVVQAIALRARESSFFASIGSGITAGLTLATPCGAWQFQRAGAAGEQLLMVDGCAVPPQTTVLIDGVRSRVTNFSASNAGNPTQTRLVRIDLAMSHRLGASTDNRQDTEILQTDLYLRNAP